MDGVHLPGTFNLAERLFLNRVHLLIDGMVAGAEPNWHTKFTVKPAGRSQRMVKFITSGWDGATTIEPAGCEVELSGSKSCVTITERHFVPS
jgi:hypothetical protein